jgi:hypothetical protein
MEIWSSKKIRKKDHRGHKLMVPIFTTAGENTLLCLVSSLTEYIRQSTQNEIEYVK